MDLTKFSLQLKGISASDVEYNKSQATSKPNMADECWRERPGFPREQDTDGIFPDAEGASYRLAACQ